MQLIRLLSTTTFRVALIYMLLFAASVLLLLAFIYWNTSAFMERQTEETLLAEIKGLREQYDRLGLRGLAQTIKQRSANPGDSIYLLTGPAKTKIAGNLDDWPVAESRDDGWVSFTYERRVLGAGDLIEEREARGRVFRVRNLFYLIVARDVHERNRIENTILQNLASAMLLMIALGFVGGIIISRNIMRRLEEVNETSRDIISGDLSRRVPVSGSGDELDQLATNLNAMLDQIERLMTGMRNVTDNVAHDLRSPLNRIRSRLEVTLMQSCSEEELRTALERTVDEVDAVIHTFNALLSIARVEAGSRREDRTDVDLKALLDDVTELYEPVAEDKQLTFTVEAGPVPPVRANRELVSQALANLIDNAVKYTEAEGRVLVSLRTVPPATPNGARRVELSVSDTGPGIPEDDRGRVRDRFVRLETSRNTPGSGLGLSLVQAVARMHGATLELRDGLPRNGGHGLEAVLSFPVG
ncbi:MAG: sensor histidine kinase [Alphaproteobacteria bacterium]